MRAEGRRGFSNGGDRPRARAAPVVATDHGRLFQQRNVAERACVRWCTSGAATIAKRRSKGDGPAGADREDESHLEWSSSPPRARSIGIFKPCISHLTSACFIVSARRQHSRRPPGRRMHMHAVCRCAAPKRCRCVTFFDVYVCSCLHVPPTRVCVCLPTIAFEACMHACIGSIGQVGLDRIFFPSSGRSIEATHGLYYCDRSKGRTGRPVVVYEKSMARHGPHQLAAGVIGRAPCVHSAFVVIDCCSSADADASECCTDV